MTAWGKKIFLPAKISGYGVLENFDKAGYTLPLEEDNFTITMYTEVTCKTEGGISQAQFSEIEWFFFLAKFSKLSCRNIYHELTSNIRSAMAETALYITIVAPTPTTIV